MSWLSRLASAAVQRQIERLRRDRTVWKDRAITAERHATLAGLQVFNQNRVLQEQAEELASLRSRLADLVDANTHLEAENETLCARNVVLAQRVTTAEGQLSRAVTPKPPAIKPEYRIVDDEADPLDTHFTQFAAALSKPPPFGIAQYAAWKREQDGQADQ